MSGMGFEDLEAARARVGRRPRVRDMAPLYRPGFLIIRLYRALSPATLLVEGAAHIEERIEQYLEAHRDSSFPRYPRRALQGLLHWLIEAPETAPEAREQAVHRGAAFATGQGASPEFRTETGRPRQCPVGERPAMRASDYSLRLLPEHGHAHRPSTGPSVQLRSIETSTRNSSATFSSPQVESPDDSSILDCDRESQPSWLPRIGILPSLSIGLGRDDDEFDGRVLVIQWGRFVFEIFLGSHA